MDAAAVHDRRTSMPRTQSAISGPIRWADICRALRVMGHMENFSKTECLRIAQQLQKRVDQGKAVRRERGLYDVHVPKRAAYRDEQRIKILGQFKGRKGS